MTLIRMSKPTKSQATHLSKIAQKNNLRTTRDIVGRTAFKNFGENIFISADFVQFQIPYSYALDFLKSMRIKYF